MSPAPDKPLRSNQFQILLALADKPLHGYAIRAEVLERTDGTVNLWPGMLYRSLKGLLEEGLIRECPPPDDAPSDARERHYYDISPTGQHALATEATRMAAYVDAARQKRVLPGHV